MVNNCYKKIDDENYICISKCNTICSFWMGSTFRGRHHMGVQELQVLASEYRYLGSNQNIKAQYVTRLLTSVPHKDVSLTFYFL